MNSHDHTMAVARLPRRPFHMRSSFIDKKTVLISAAALLATLASIWMLYAIFGHWLLRELYHSPRPGIVDLFMPGRADTRVEQYYYAADIQIINVTLWSIALYLLIVAILHQPLGFLVSAVSFAACTLVFFTIFELFPSLAQSLRLGGVIPYYAYKLIYIADDQLAYREKPWRHDFVANYSVWGEEARVNGIQEPARSLEWITDEDGFRNSPPKPSADVVVLGDSFIEYGDNTADTFPSRLERHLPGWSVADLGKSGYGPFQYLEVLKRYGIKKMPGYALFSFYEGNDISDIRSYTEWRNGKGSYNSVYQVGSLSFLERYYVAGRQALRLFGDAVATAAERSMEQLLRIHYSSPDLVVIRTKPNRVYKTSFVDTFAASEGKDLLVSKEWIQLRNILSEFKTVCLSHDIVPVILYIPAPVSVYAEYTTPESGDGWSSIRDQHIASRKIRLNAMTQLSQELGIQMIDLLPTYERAAKNGDMLYELFNVHWNAEGRELAARIVAGQLEQMTKSLHTQREEKNKARFNRVLG